MSAARCDRETVVLMHGLWLNGTAMAVLAWRLARCGFDVVRFSYPSMKSGLDENASRLEIFCRSIRAQRLHLVGHSLGGLVILAALARSREPGVRRAVLIGSPYAGSGAAAGLARFGAGERMLGQTLKDWLEAPRPAIPRDVEVGVIAGDLPFGLGRLVAHLAGPNDGVVCVEETKVPGAKDAVVLHINHTGMLFSPAVGRAACAFLKAGSFGHA